ncbi:acetyl-CoA carboxylase biotin carboxylase subunit [Candidatus Desantisbacteria bacterium CG23_combo_of_CG06-09_8_20_14_all_40_23]|uniref:Biotin carboxylase n=1 Tax=Candidatus Desantisbacteria bacterium CG23_combo_of_CG06-09_8_20_14_all_40_23 TaxID=1974550 RepID=A0A2H0A2Q5_9BACT|nr:MAG: acetyl-CoA carboxylase biotin carboxylase subunit [Candidatus Desantisbacteria bacterium CG23_combo_of_CG06-09_8_20_14_all_40_23]
MFKKILIANRGEIALRIIRAAKDLEIKTVAVYSKADTDSLHTQLADERVCIGPAPASGSYLNIPQVISAAIITECDAIHPGYGFLAENATFAEICIEHNIAFIGPSPDVIASMGDKIKAKVLMKKADVPIVHGSLEAVSNLDEIKKIIQKIGYPVIIKAAAGGGGKGIRIIEDSSQLEPMINAARLEAEKAFKDSSLYIEKYIQKPRHIEVQILGDNYGNIIHLGERECSIQSRHQKLIEETPPVNISQKIKQKMCEIAVRAARSVKYKSAGTIEFLFDSREKKFYFIEMNTRIQVEHPVTELATGIDLVKLQIQLAAGEKLKLTQKDIVPSGHAIECRINAVDPDNNFAPSPGKIESLHLPGGPGVRLDTHIYAGYTIPPNYDSMIAKLITYGEDRKEALSRMRRALSEFIVNGIKTTIPFHLRILNDSSFIKGDIHTHFLSCMDKKNNSSPQIPTE